ncbi:PH domain-containing protein [Actinacidiphila oryziradicis]|uniref:PH domain-containing protein n=1 Tax=Actinacidiphila oryziradicis TaxID=2571141 RepID=A0A4U0SWS5_9ACTN|nr:PH domain-containing protein [Actinacidiphila oryziradicis]TKA12527.1 PH domain-containing protein [Actinacidiphila oryziradicis]
MPSVTPVTPVTTPALPVVFRPVRTRVVLLSVGTLVLGVFTVLALLMPHGGARPWGAGDRLTLVAAGALVFAVLTLLSRPKVVADQGGVTVVNLTTRRRLAWAEVVRVNLRPGDPWVQLDLADGTSLAAMGIQPGIGRERAVRDAASLRALAEVYGTGESAAR